MPIEWYRTAPGAPDLGRTTSFMSLDWTSSTETRVYPSYTDEPWLQRPGEVFGEPRPYSPRPVPIGLTYGHVCGTDEEFNDGAEYDPERNVDYDEQGLPLCCGGPIVPVFDLVVGFEGELEPAGDTCEDAIEIEMGELITGTIGPGQERWWKVPVTGGATYHITYTVSGTSGIVSVISAWSGCVGGFVYMAGAAGVAQCISSAMFLGQATLPIRVNDTVGGTGRTYSWKIEPGPC